jgi:hypothetical protein
VSADESRFGFSAQAWAKLNPRLQKEIARRRGERGAVVPVMISMAGLSDSPRDASVEAKQRTFASASAPLFDQLRRNGAMDIQGYWINWTISAMVPIEALREITERNDVTQVLLVEPHRAVCWG